MGHVLPYLQLIFPLEVSGKDVPEVKEKETSGSSTHSPEMPPTSSSSSSTNPTIAILFMLLALSSACDMYL